MKFEMIVYHYTRLKDFRLFPITIKNSAEYWCKPHGGIWCSPVNCSFGWEDCDAGEQFIQEGMTKIELKLEGEFIIIDTYEDLDQFDWFECFENTTIEGIDFEKLVKKGVDGIYLTEEGERQTRYPYGFGVDGSFANEKFRNMSGWDCETVLILNEKCIRDWKVVDFDISRDKLERKRIRTDTMSKAIEELLNEKLRKEK